MMAASKGTLLGSSLRKLPCAYRQIPVTLREVFTLAASAQRVNCRSGQTGGEARNPYSHRQLLLRNNASRHGHIGRERDQRHVPEASPWNVANLITCGRIAVAPVIGYCIMNSEYDVALGGLMFAATSDWLDGILARRLKLHTVLGSYLDPAADKLLITIASLSLAAQSIIPIWLVSLIIGRDVALVTGWVALTLRKRPQAPFRDLLQVFRKTAMEPIFISKLNTTFQVALAFAGVLSAGEMSTLTDGTLHTVGFATAITTCASGLSYGRQFWTRWNHL